MKPYISLEQNENLPAKRYELFVWTKFSHPSSRNFLKFSVSLFSFHLQLQFYCDHDRGTGNGEEAFGKGHGDLPGSKCRWRMTNRFHDMQNGKKCQWCLLIYRRIVSCDAIHRYLPIKISWFRLAFAMFIRRRQPWQSCQEIIGASWDSNTWVTVFMAMRFRAATVTVAVSRLPRQMPAFR